MRKNIFALAVENDCSFSRQDVLIGIGDNSNNAFNPKLWNVAPTQISSSEPINPIDSLSNKQTPLASMILSPLTPAIYLRISRAAAFGNLEHGLLCY